MSCCSSSCQPNSGTNEFFSSQAESFLKKFRRKGLDKESRLLELGILDAGVKEASLLEIGCGVGGLHLRLLQAGASRASGVDIAAGMIEGAKTLSAELNLSDRTQYRVGDFAAIHGEFQPADIVILDKVVCCYEQIDELLKESLSRTRKSYALVYPRPYTVAKGLFKAFIAVMRVIRGNFQPFWHDWNAMTQTILASGFTESYSASTVLWAVKVYRRN